ncbi:HNH endonuclease signature motif containing protein [Microbacterium sp. NC79]|uniref:HNH endonuclease signature motif containing protein n=1 Tax=Microbacterium sp. NC79 TaxID=2851009 RepID=UPI001C2B95D5|nr:HNH endonuclease signature motif containing protein [Microbacterium sp. NC79]MBV0895406.1 HNH endonuclease [Microbacterium sp. NC79]
MSNPHLTPLLEAVAALESAWCDAECGTDLDRTQLLAVNAAMGTLQRRFDGLRAEVAAGIEHESRPELGPDGLAKQQGFRNSATLIAATTGGTTGDASKLTKLGKATAPRSNLLGEKLPPKYPAVQDALQRGTIAAAAGSLIVAMLDRARLNASIEQIVEAEALLVEGAAGLSCDDVRKLVTRAEAWLNPDGVEPREDEARASRSLTMFERDGSLFVNFRTDVASGAPIKNAIQAWVTATFQARNTNPNANAGHSDTCEGTATGSGVPNDVGTAAAGDAPEGWAMPGDDRRTVAQLQADALTAICEHITGCDNNELPLTGATVIVRVSLDDLTAGTGVATIDGTDQPISISTCRQMAASGGVIPAVLGSDGEILDWGREKRLFTKAQRLALVERDGGCVMCGLPPQMTKAHHIRWWQRDTGPTDLNNGVLLCTSCHHRIHDNGWTIHVDGTKRTSKVWIIPPATVDPTQTPRLGGRARYDIAA